MYVVTVFLKALLFLKVVCIIKYRLENIQNETVYFYFLICAIFNGPPMVYQSTQIKHFELEQHIYHEHLQQCEHITLGQSSQVKKGLSISLL